MKNITIALLDYGIGNVKSISNALENLGAHTILTSKREEILNADAVILPGVGAFAKGMQNLEYHQLVPTIHEFIATDKPFMGICLGMQMLLDESEEFGNNKGLGLINGKVIKLPLKHDANEKLPHVCWNEIEEPIVDKWNQTILNNIPLKSDVYFVHTFVASPVNKNDILATAEYGQVHFCAALHKDNIFGVQFHPEKSGEVGLQILRNFIQLIK